MSRPFSVNSVVLLTILGIYCGHLRGVVGTDDDLVHIPLQKSQDVSSKVNSVGPDMVIKSSTLDPSNAFKDQISIIEGQLNTGLDALSKNDVDKSNFADAKTESVPLDTKPVPLDAAQGQIETTQSKMNKGLDVFQASTKQPGAASDENDKTDVLNSMPADDDFQVDDDDDDDDDSSKEQTKPKWFDEMMDDEDEEKKEKEDGENDDYINYDGNGKFKIKENFVANRPIRAEQSMVSFYTWILLVIVIAVFTFLIFKNRHKVQGYILHFSRRRSNGSKLNGEEAKKLMTHEYA
ncbi:hypothetical protein ACJMK2_034574 [Sinanodonta woodiana]|uniref:Uncharacterized protein n=1 Tax=Sinanodonta woodiana TaxID=1069815 RepID=A0ABD3WS33_SINWO